MARSKTSTPNSPARSTTVRRKPTTQRVRDAGQIALLDSPVRQAIVDTIEALGGEADIATVAAELGRPADGLYYHFDQLARGGLLQSAGTDGPRRYRVGDTPGTRLQLDYQSSVDNLAALERVVGRLLQSSRREFGAALHDPATVTEGKRRELWAGRTTGWLDAAGLARVNALLTEIQHELHRPRQPGCDRLYSVAFVLAPIAAEGPRRAARKR